MRKDEINERAKEAMGVLDELDRNSAMRERFSSCLMACELLGIDYDYRDPKFFWWAIGMGLVDDIRECILQENNLPEGFDDVIDYLLEIIINNNLLYDYESRWCNVDYDDEVFTYRILLDVGLDYDDAILYTRNGGVEIHSAEDIMRDYDYYLERYARRCEERENAAREFDEMISTRISQSRYWDVVEWGDGNYYVEFLGDEV